MSVRCAPSMFLCPEHFLGTVCPTLMIFGMWVGLGLKLRMLSFGHGNAGPLGPLGSKMLNNALWLPNLVRRTTDASLRWWWLSWRSKVIRGQMGLTLCCGYYIWSKELLMQAKNDDLHGGQRSSEVKYGKLCATATISSQKNNWCKLRMMMTFMEVKSHHRSNVVNYGMATIFGQKSRWCKLRMMMTFMEVKGQQRSNISKQWSVVTKLGQKNCWCKFRIMMTFMEVKGQNIINNALWLPNLVRRPADERITR